MTSRAALAADGDRRRAGGLSWGGSLLAPAVVTVTRPVAWAIALAGFLVRGGILVLTLPIVVLPTPSGLQNVLGGPVSSLIFGAPSQELIVLAVALIVGAVVLLVVGSYAGAWAERLGIRTALDAAADEGFLESPVSLAGAPGPGRIAIVRLLGLLPPAVALVLGARDIYDAAYLELVLPAELRTPLPVRIVAAAPDAFGAILLAWLVGDTAASLGVRRLVLGRLPTLVAWLAGWWDLVRRLPGVLVTTLATVGTLVIAVGPGIVATVIGWERVREAFLAGRDPVGMALSVIVWVAVWLGVLVLAGFASAFRTAAWTFVAPRRG